MSNILNLNSSLVNLDNVQLIEATYTVRIEGGKKYYLPQLIVLAEGTRHTIEYCDKFDDANEALNSSIKFLNTQYQKVSNNQYTKSTNE